MLETIHAHLYDFPQYYDLVFGSDWQAEFRFLRAALACYTKRKVRSIFEPACGTGRLLVRFAKHGLKSSGLDLNSKAIDYCNRRLQRAGYPATAFVGDMTDFRLKKPADAAFNMINSFRHLTSEELARDHLRCMAEAVAPGGLYFLGLHLTPTRGEPMEEETWAARRGNLAVISRLWTKRVDLRRRAETLGLWFDIYTPTRQFRIEDETAFRTYTAPQMADLIASVPKWEIAATHDFAYTIAKPIVVTASTQDVVYVLRRK